jgi:tRNA nucleotidyltransferase (CCA-adding enzyme)
MIKKMHVILTHEQADFDALASLLGAQLVHKGAIAVLPNRLNRNLRAYLTLYGTVLPFVERRDLPNVPIERVTLVDTQSLISVRGMHPGTTVVVIDHHPPRTDLPESWQVTTEDTGANTTLFVEALLENETPVNMVEATLLLLGIYEDTGSLTYSRTTARDLRAAAYLIDQGADLNIANNFLNHPLSLDQEKLYAELREHASLHTIQGHSVVLSMADAREVDEELSTIAHKLRNVMEPDALFLLVQTRGGVQIIARSTNDQIDVGAVAAHFGGGGHSRAAAALVKRDDPEKVREELLESLPRFISPAVTVAQLMSRGAQVLSVETSAEEAAQRMQRYGYEGYPVVEDGRLVGLLTRRAVDRAISHNLNLTAGSLMQAGHVTVTPHDSIEHLQNLMTETGWGQVPVIHPESDEIIGIVTRTDLLKTLSQTRTVTGRQNLAARLESALPAARLALIKAAAAIAHTQRSALYIVGGFVRDLLLDLPSYDLDLVVEGDAINLAKLLQKTYGGRLTSHGRFGTAKWHITEIREALCQQLTPANGRPLVPEDLPESLDLITARTEFYTHPTALPTIERGSIKLDLHRRDFTINTLALRLDGAFYGELHDYWGGVNDLKEMLVRVLHSISFVDDPTRMLRAVRYEQRYGFSIESRTLQLLMEARPLLDRVSGERIRHELDHIFDEEHCLRMLHRLNELGLLEAIHPALIFDEWLAERLARVKMVDAEPFWQLPSNPRGYPLKRVLCFGMWNLRLDEKTAGEILERLVYPRQLSDQIMAAVRLRDRLPSLIGKRPSQIAARLDAVPPIGLYIVYLATDREPERQLLVQYCSSWRDQLPFTSGNDLRQSRLPPGPHYQRILTALREAWLDGQIASKADEEALLDVLIQKEYEGGV